MEKILEAKVVYSRKAGLKFQEGKMRCFKKHVNYLLNV